MGSNATGLENFPIDRSVMKTILTANVPLAYRKDGVAWLVLEGDNKGYHLYMCDSPLEKEVMDYWFENIDKAKLAAEEEWGVKSKDWKSND